MRLHQPTGIWLLFAPCAWSLTLAGDGWPSVYLMLLFAIGAITMRGAGCIINDIADREFDKQVERTKNRPLASGELSVGQALALLILLLAISAYIAWSLGVGFMLYAALALIPVGIYPLMKRITWWPQAFLGITFNLGAILGWIAAKESIGLPALLLYAAGICWTLGYDTIYGHQDKQDDMRIGVKSTAQLFGDKNTWMLWVFYDLFLLFLVLTGVSVSASISYYLALLPVVAHCKWQLLTLDTNSPENCNSRFRSNRWLGFLVFTAMMAV